MPCRFVWMEMVVLDLVLRCRLDHLSKIFINASKHSYGFVISEIPKSMA